MRRHLTLLVVLVICMTLLAGCGGGSPTLPPSVISVSLFPAQATVKAGSQFPFQATVQGSANASVIWRVDSVPGGNPALGTIDTAGIYTAPSILPTPPVVTITATAQADPTKSATASVTVIIGVTVLPPIAALNLSSPQCPVTQQFGAVITGTGNAGVDWSIVANGATVGSSDTTFGTIDVTGLYATPNTIPNPPNFKVTAKSQADTAQSGSANVSVSAGGPGVDQSAQNAPVRLGTSGGNADDKSTGSCCSGTLGALVSRNGEQFILSNNHVLARKDLAQPGEPITQPGLVDNGCVAGPLVANFAQAVKLQNANNTAVADAALALVAPGQVDATGAILQLGPVSCGLAGPAPPASTTIAPSIGMLVAKSGRTTGLTCGTITAVAVDNVKVQYETSCGATSSFTVTFNNQVVIQSSTFGSGGDSGSLIVNSDTAEPTALLFGGDSTSGVVVANPIQDVLAALPDPSTQELPVIVGGSKHAVQACSGPSASAMAQSKPQAMLRSLEVERAKIAKTKYLATLTADPAVLGVGIGAGDKAGEAAIVVFVEREKARRPIPAILDGVAIQVKTIGPLRAFGTSFCSAGNDAGAISLR
jgi:hypothetical protein